MREILVTASAPSREAALAMMATLGIARVTDEYPGGYIVPLVQVHIGEVPGKEGRDVSLWNFWYYGETAAALMKPEPVEGWGQYDGLFEKTYLLEMIDARTGIAMQWAALSADPVPPGYETPDGCRLYSPDLIATPELVKA